MLCWNLRSSPKHRGSFQKNMTFPEGNKLFAGDFRANLDGTNADMVQFTKVSSAPKYVHLQGWSLRSGPYDGWVKYKEKAPDMPDPNQMLKQHVIPNSILQNLKIFSSKGCRKRWIVCMYLANTAILNIRFSSRRYYFRLWVFALTGEYF